MLVAASGQSPPGSSSFSAPAPRASPTCSCSSRTPGLLGTPVSGPTAPAARPRRLRTARWRALPEISRAALGAGRFWRGVRETLAGWTVSPSVSAGPRQPPCLGLHFPEPPGSRRDFISVCSRDLGASLGERAVPAEELGPARVRPLKPKSPWNRSARLWTSNGTFWRGGRKSSSLELCGGVSYGFVLCVKPD